MQSLGMVLVKGVEKIKNITGLYTYQVEFLFVITALVAVVFIRHGIWIEYVGALAVFFSFAHAKVANRLSEREEYRRKNDQTDKIVLTYYYKTKRYFYLKEMLWFAYFILLGAWSALVGCVIFLLYEPWRKLWRMYHPLSEKLK